jgi:hypothetical protein
MKRLVIPALALSLVLVTVIAPALATTPAKRLVRLSGWVVDEEAGADHANEASKATVLAKAEEGVPLAFYTTKGDLYKLRDQEKALEHVGEQWDVIGSLDDEGNLSVGSYIKPRKPPQPDAEGGSEGGE